MNLSRSEGWIRLHTASSANSPDLPLVTVITATYNASQYIQECLDSVAAQNYPNIEHLVLDGGSTDGTVDILQANQHKIAVWRSERDDGVFDAWNKGLDLAQGEWVAFLGADDIYLPNAVSTYMQLAHAHPEAEFLSSRARLDHNTGYCPAFGGPWLWPQFSRAMTTIHVGAMHRRSIFARLGRFDPSFRIAGDYDLMLRAKDTLKCAFTPAITVVMRAGGLSDSTKGLYEARRAKIANGVKSPFAANLELRRKILRFHLRRMFLTLRSWFR